MSCEPILEMANGDAWKSTGAISVSSDIEGNVEISEETFAVTDTASKVWASAGLGGTGWSPADAPGTEPTGY
jgi:transglutaminase-like putative cysteine protease